MTQVQNNPKGILFILLGMATFSIQDALIKFVYEDSALYELYFGRTFVALVLLVGYLKYSKQKINLITHYPFLTILRVICFFFGFSFFYISLTYMSLAMANALFFSSPFFVSILATIFLKEKVGIRRWSAIFVGFLGVYIVLDPDFSNFDYMKLAPVACALCYSISMTITKITSDKDNVYTQMIHLYLGALLISILFFIFTGEGQFDNFDNPAIKFIFREWFTNVPFAWPFIIAMGCIGAFAFYFVFNAYSIASPSVVSLYEYSLIIWSILIGYIVFNNIPSPRTFIGVTIIITAGIYIYLREKTKDQLIVTDTPTR
ncbi:DMT family transporter [Candidatus Pelagibacter bacterium]|nr:DMT family transporter [Candidatus Pelagibacter bacterium]|tara:strand:- start:612 stop:1562 length:951 start_codon:yes stop_codon:yes gene_type:complete